MKIPKDVAEKVVTGTMKEIWDTFINIEGEYPEFEENYEDIRFGIEVMFEIYDLWENTNQIVRKDKSGEVVIRGKVYKVQAFRTEKENRRKMMVEAILNNVDNVDVTTPR